MIMSITNYIINLKESTDLSYMELAKQIGLTYQNIMDLKNDRIQTVSKTVLSKLAKYENRPKRDVLYDIMYKEDEEEVLKEHSKYVLLYLCDLYLDNCATSLYPNFPSPISITLSPMYFGGMAYKKRINNSNMLIDSWDSLKREHWRLFKRATEYSKDEFAEYYINENAFVYDVLMYAIGKVLTIKEMTVKEYIIVFDKSNEYEMQTVQSFEIEKANFKIKYVYIED